MSNQLTVLHQHAELINRLGGPSKLAKALGFNGAGSVQRVQNWKYRGIPEVIFLRNPQIFGAWGEPDQNAAAA